MELKKYTLGQLIDVTRGASLGGEHYATKGDYIRLTCGNFDYRNNCFKENDSKDNIYYTGNFKKEFLLDKGDIITPLTEQAIGLLGSTAIIPESGKYIQSQDIAKIICNENLLDKKYAFYLISSKGVKQQLSAAAQQTKIRHTSPDKIKACTVWIPSLPTQRKVAELLSALDQKIALNRTINQQLEQLARTIYNYYFLQFHTPLHDTPSCPQHPNTPTLTYNPILKKNIPIGWEVKTLGEIANITMGQSPIGESYNNDGNGVIFYQGSTDFGERFPKVRQYTTAPTRLAKKGDILMSVRAPVGDINIANNDCCIGRGLVALNSKMGHNAYLYYVMWSFKELFDRKSGIGTTFGSINKDELYNLQVLVQTREILDNYERICTPMFDKQLNIDKEITTLTTYRDALLPLLMNGQVEV